MARGVFEGAGDLPRCVRRGRLATVEWREPASCDRLPVHRSESPTGYSSAGCSPAEPASASPVTDIVVQSRSSAAIKCAAQLPCRDAVQVAPPRARRERECHLYFARRVSFLSCADRRDPKILLSYLRMQR